MSIVDLGSSANIESVVLHPRGDGPNAGKGLPVDFTIQVCEQGEPWKTVVEKENYPAPQSATPLVIDLPKIQGRYVKVEATKLREAEPGYYRFQLAKIEILGQIMAASPLQLDLLDAKLDNPGMPLAMRKSRRSRRHGRRIAQALLVDGIDRAGAASNGLPRIGRVFRRAACRRSKAIFGIPARWKATVRSLSVTAESVFLRAKRFWWKVMLWDKDGKPMKWSEPATFLTGKFQPEDWKGRWIGASEDPRHKPVYLRKEIEIAKPVKKAIVFFCGLGHSELFIEGKRVGDYLAGRALPATTNECNIWSSTSPSNSRNSAAKRSAWFCSTAGTPWNATRGFIAFTRNPMSINRNFCWTCNLNTKTARKRSSRPMQAGDGQQRPHHAGRGFARGRSTGGWTCPAGIPPDFRTTAGKTCRWFPVPRARLVVQKEPPTRMVETIRPERLDFDAAAQHLDLPFRSGVHGIRSNSHFGDAGKTSAGHHDLATIRRLLGVPGRVNTYTFAGQGVEEFRPDFIHSSITQVRVEGAEKPLSLEDLRAAAYPALTTYRAGSAARTIWSTGCTNRPGGAMRTMSLTCRPIRRGNSRHGWKTPTTCSGRPFILFDSQTMYERWQCDILDCQRPDGNLPNVAPGRCSTNTRASGGAAPPYGFPGIGICISAIRNCSKRAIRA